ncbi:MAG: glycosyltransferase [Planctomycetota bacterium]|nr:glycosyltransferase [Planctomycetota bacterium]
MPWTRRAQLVVKYEIDRLRRANPLAGVRLTPGQLGLRPPLFKLRHHAPRPFHIPGRYYRIDNAHDGPTISIVTPSYNQARFLGRTIDSILSQGYAKLEYFVQDGGSNDGSADVLKSYGDRFGWVSQRDKGQADAIRTGFARINGDVMGWLNSDDMLLPGTLNYVGRYFAEHPEVDVIYGHRVLIDQDDNEIGRWVVPPHNSETLRWVDTIPQETMFWRRSLYDKVGGVDASFQFAMDWDLILRFIEADAKFVRVPRFLGAFRVHQDQKTLARAADLGLPEIKKLRQRTLGRVPTKPQIARHLSGYLAQHLVLHAGYRLGLVRY